MGVSVRQAVARMGLWYGTRAVAGDAPRRTITKPN